MTLRLLPIDAADYDRHPLHRSERIWSETNCYVDVWIEVLHSLGVEPLAASAFALATDFEGDQWTFFKFPPEDLKALFGIRVFEMNPWRSVLDHVVEHLESGRLVTVEVDGWYLPDTAGVSYRTEHPKTTIVPNLVDVEGRRLGYFHNASYFELSGEDFDGVFRRGGSLQEGTLVPYLESIRLDRFERPSREVLVERALSLLAVRVGEMPADDPVARFRVRLDRDLEWLRSAGIDGFHRWAFGAVRQFGASAEVGAAHLQWLAGETGGTGLTGPADRLLEIAAETKALQFQLARLARGRSVDVDPAFERLSTAWTEARDGLVDHVR